MVTIRFFASIKDRVGSDSLKLAINGPISVKDLLVMVARDKNIDQSILTNHGLLHAVNEKMESLDFMVNDNDEVAVLPPLSGGF